MPDSDCIDALIVGAGFSGIYQLHTLREAGFDAHLYDTAEELGGIWYWNCYPGARVDSHVPVYQLSVEKLWKEWNWTERFPAWSEVRDYFRFAVDRLNLKPHITLGTRITEAAFDQAADLWRVRTSRGESLRCRYLILCTGFASKPYVPDFKGLEDFEGACHHTAEWPQAGLSFAGKRVGVIGSGASAIQVIQSAARDAAELTVFQRTPNMALPMQQEALDARTQEELKPWYPEILARRRKTFGGFEFDFDEGPFMSLSPLERRHKLQAIWGMGGLHFWVGNFFEVMVDEAANEEAYRFWRQKTLPRIKDPAVAAILAPEQKPHPFGTKRLSLEQGYYEVFNQDNVTLVDLKTTSIDHVTRSGVVTSAGEHELDILVMGTGFDAGGGGMLQIDLTGREGSRLDQRWADGLKTHLGMASAEFPNMFFHYGPQSPSGFSNGPGSIEVQVDWLTDCLKYMREQGLTRIEAEKPAEKAWGEHCSEIVNQTLFPKANSWYMRDNIPGSPREVINYPGGIAMYDELCQQSAAEGYSGFTVS